MRDGDLISRSALLEEVPKWFPNTDFITGEILRGVKAATNGIQAAPAVDAVEVVRCKDCKWFGPNNEDSWFGCAIDTRCEEDRPKGNDFCSYGERRGGE